jgi:cytochrome c5
MKLLPIAGGLALSVLGVAAAPAQALPNARAVYDANCAACHATGIVGAPRTGDAQAWSARIDAGINVLYASAIRGKGAMPPKGGNASLTDAQVMAAVNHIVSSTALPKAAPKTAQGSSKALDTAKGGVRVIADGTKGKLVYQAVCAACHSSGLAGAPKLGDSAAWAPRAGAGAAPLYASAIKGKGAMPPKGGNASLPDADVRAAVDFMLAQVRGDTPSPQAAPVAP